jgi:hypothetical protein
MLYGARVFDMQLHRRIVCDQPKPSGASGFQSKQVTDVTRDRTAKCKVQK